MAISGQWRTIPTSVRCARSGTAAGRLRDVAPLMARGRLWSCIRFTRAPGKTRLFYRWEARRLTDRDWTPKGIALMANPCVSETQGGLQAPFVLKVGATYYMLYGDWEQICLATSVDGKANWIWRAGVAAIVTLPNWGVLTNRSGVA